MAKKKYPKNPELQRRFIEAINNYSGFEVIKSGVVSLIKFDNREYYLYFKCISHEGNPYPLECQRAQLPERPEFNEVISSKNPFIFLGYDVDNDVYVCWEPAKIKSRLNKKSYVSFYSRLSAQQAVVAGDIKEEVLTNGDKFVLFKRQDVVPFFQMIDTHFEELKECNNTSVSDNKSDYSNKINLGQDLQGKLSSVEDDVSIKLLIDSFSSETPSLDIIAACMNEYGTDYYRMSFSDWANVVRNYLKSK